MACARERGQSGASIRLREVGIEERELAQRVHELCLRSKHRYGRLGPQAAETAQKVAVRPRNRLEVPRLRHDLLRLADAPQLRSEAQQVCDRPVARHRPKLCLPLDMRRDPQPVAERAEACPRKLRANSVPNLAPFLAVSSVR